MINRFSKKNQNNAPLGISLLMMILLAWGCSPDSGTPPNLLEFRKMSTEAIELYTSIHPLRCSRLGMLRADSSLFTFSGKEIDAALKELNRLLEKSSTLTTEGLSQKDIYDSQLVLGWLEGERFALNDLRLYEINPMLYCWMINEALWGIPSRQYPPGDDELEDYRTRIEKLPVLIENAGNLCRKPSQLHIEFSLKMLDRLLESSDQLKALVQERYHEEVVWLDQVLEVIEDFRSYIRYDLSERSHGRIILGSENLARIFEYDEHLSENPNNLLREADKRIRKLMVSRRTLNRSMERLTGSKDSEGVEGGSSLDPVFKSAETAGDILNHIKKGPIRHGPLPEYPYVILSRNPLDFNSFRENSFLSLPYGGERPVRWTPSLLDGEDEDGGFITINTGRLNIDERSGRGLADLSDGELSLLRYRITEALLMRKECRSSFPAPDTLRSVFCGETHLFGCLSEVLSEQLDHRPGGFNIRLHSIDQAILDLARAAAVFRLHGGNYSIESATGFFMETAGLEKNEAVENVYSVLVSPAVAYAGLALLITEDISDRLRTSKDLELRSRKTLQILRSHQALPVSFIEDIYFD